MTGKDDPSIISPTPVITTVPVDAGVPVNLHVPNRQEQAGKG